MPFRDQVFYQPIRLCQQAAKEFFRVEIRPMKTAPRYAENPPDAWILKLGSTAEAFRGSNANSYSAMPAKTDQGMIGHRNERT